MTRIERKCRTAWLLAMANMLREQWIGFRSERVALQQTKVRLENELYQQR